MRISQVILEAAYRLKRRTALVGPEVPPSANILPTGVPSSFAAGTPTLKGGAQRIIPETAPGVTGGVRSSFAAGIPTLIGGANPGVSVYIGGVLFPILVDGASDPIPGAGAATKPTYASQTIGRWTCQFDVFSQNNQFIPKIGQTIQLFDFGTRRFAGCINEVVSELLTGSQPYYNGTQFETGQVVHHVYAVDKSAILDHRVVNVVYKKGTDVVGAVIDLIFNWCAAEGISLNTLGPSIGPLDQDEQFYFVTVTSALDKLATDNGCVWWVDQNSDLHFVPIVSLPPCPYTIDTTSLKTTNPSVRAISVRSTLLSYRNKEWVTSNLQVLPGSGSGALSITETYTLPQAAATAAGFYLGCIITNFPIGQITKLTVNGVTQPTYLGSAGFNFRHAWWFFPGAPYLYAPNVQNDVPAFPNPPVTSPDPNIGDSVSITYVPWAPVNSPTGVVPSAGLAIGAPLTATGGTCGSGIYEYVDQVKNVNRLNDLNAIAQDILNKAGGVPKYLQFETDLGGAQVGQQLNVNLPELGASPSDVFMITSIQATDQGGDLGHGSAFRSVIVAQTGQDLGNQIKWFEHLVARTENALPVLQYEEAVFVLAPGGSIAAGVNQTNPYIVGRSGRLIEVLISASTPPVGQNLIIDILDQPGGVGTPVSIFPAVKPQLTPSGTLVDYTTFANGLASFVFAQDVLTLNTSYGITGSPVAQAGAVTVKLRWAI